jgi:hypothetical protein
MNNLYKKIMEEVEREGINIDPSVEYEEMSDRTFKFTDGDKIYHVVYTVSLTEEGKRVFDFKFRLMNNPKSPKSSDFKTDLQYQIALRKSQYGITGTGNSKKIFDKVISIMVKILNTERPEYISFQADEKNRQKLYTLLLRTILKKIKGYEYIDENPITGEMNGPGDFWLERN